MSPISSLSSMPLKYPFSFIPFKELNTLVYELPQKYATNGHWVMSRKTLGEINGLVDLQGNPIFRQPELRQEEEKVELCRQWNAIE